MEEEDSDDNWGGGGERVHNASNMKQNAWAGGTFQATTGFQDSDLFQKAMKMASGCTLSVTSHLSDCNVVPRVEI